MDQPAPSRGQISKFPKSAVSSSFQPSIKFQPLAHAVPTSLLSGTSVAASLAQVQKSEESKSFLVKSLDHLKPDVITMSVEKTSLAPSSLELESDSNRDTGNVTVSPQIVSTLQNVGSTKFESCGYGFTVKEMKNVASRKKQQWETNISARSSLRKAKGSPLYKESFSSDSDEKN